MANDNIEFSLLGVDELIAKFESVKGDIKFKGGRFALRKAANLVRDKAKANAKRVDDPASAADISENIAVRWSSRTFKRTGNLTFRVGIMGGASSRPTETRAGLPGGDTQHWRHVEFGTSRTRARPFMRKALSDNIGAATDEFIKQYDKALDRAIKRASK